MTASVFGGVWGLEFVYISGTRWRFRCVNKLFRMELMVRVTVRNYFGV